MVRLSELRQEKGEVWDKAQKLNDAVSERSENRSFSTEEQETWDKYMARMKEITDEIRRLETLSEIEKDLVAKRANELDDKQRAKREKAGPPLKARADMNDFERAQEVRSSEEYGSAFDSWIRGGVAGMSVSESAQLRAPELRALEVGVATEGGNLVPTDLERQLLEVMRERNIMRGIASVFSFGNDRNIPLMTTKAVATWIAEEGAYGGTDPAYTQASLISNKAGILILVSEELLVDSAVDMNSHLAREGAAAIGDLAETGYVDGAGTTEPNGVVGGSSLGKTFAVNSAITADELIDVFHSLLRPYRRNATWLVHDTTVAAIRKLKETGNQYIWQPGLQAGEPDRMLGRPFEASADMPVIATVAKSVLFGDMSFYWIADRVGMVLLRLVERYAELGQVGFRLSLRTDGVLTLSEAVKHGVHPV